MKIVAIIEEFNKMCKQHFKFIEEVRQTSCADFIIAVMSGDYLQQGIPAIQDKYARARAVVNAGVDLVIELPVCCALQSPDTYAYAATALLDRLHCVDELYIACDTDQPDLLPEIARFLFMETMDYQKEIQAYRHRGLTFYEAQAKATGRKLPGAQHILNVPINMFAAEYARALKRLYSNIRPCFIQTPGFPPIIPAQPPAGQASDSHTFGFPGSQGSNGHIAGFPNSQGSNGHIAEFPAGQCSDSAGRCSDSAGQDSGAFPGSAYFTQLLKNELQHSPNPDHLDNISGGTATLTGKLLAQCQNITTFANFAKLLATPTRSPANIRRYLFNLIFNIRKADIALCRLYGFALYAAPLAISSKAATLLAHLKTTAWLPILPVPDGPGSTDKPASQSNCTTNNACPNNNPNAPGSSPKSSRPTDSDIPESDILEFPSLDEARQLLRTLDHRAHQHHTQAQTHQFN